ncbi:hypothetical protein BJ508DRAFT_314030 [Ascobolus immersus RN42]|uniref:Uncharacterized protein n=1 Tax=Ascobolus immersus RN42 TaxID=1160509 RepID=A0A3N4HM70_ASCIM|nr:hypothetical protein BJ508DRAFT_314030 [Ascobolus immersus RN42]
MNPYTSPHVCIRLAFKNTSKPNKPHPLAVASSRVQSKLASILHKVLARLNTITSDQIPIRARTGGPHGNTSKEQQTYAYTKAISYVYALSKDYFRKTVGNPIRVYYTWTLTFVRVSDIQEDDEPKTNEPQPPIYEYSIASQYESYLPATIPPRGRRTSISKRTDYQRSIPHTVQDLWSKSQVTSTRGTPNQLVAPNTSTCTVQRKHTSQYRHRTSRLRVNVATYDSSYLRSTGYGTGEKSTSISKAKYVCNVRPTSGEQPYSTSGSTSTSIHHENKGPLRVYTASTDAPAEATRNEHAYPKPSPSSLVRRQKIWYDERSHHGLSLQASNIHTDPDTSKTQEAYSVRDTKIIDIFTAALRMYTSMASFENTSGTLTETTHIQLPPHE